jgi:hypothetical protein
MSDRPEPSAVEDKRWQDDGKGGGVYTDGTGRPWPFPAAEPSAVEPGSQDTEALVGEATKAMRAAGFGDAEDAARIAASVYAPALAAARADVDLWQGRYSRALDHSRKNSRYGQEQRRRAEDAEAEREARAVVVARWEEAEESGFGWKDRAEDAEAERDAARAEVARLEQRVRAVEALCEAFERRTLNDPRASVLYAKEAE